MFLPQSAFKEKGEEHREVDIIKDTCKRKGGSQMKPWINESIQGNSPNHKKDNHTDRGLFKGKLSHDNSS